MTPAARLSGAIEVLADIEARRRPAADALKDWGLSHRFAGSGDRAALADLVYDALRRRASARWVMGADTPRATLLGSLVLGRGLDASAVAALCSGERFAPEPLTEGERAALEAASLDEAPDAVRADVPDWLWPGFEAAFGAGAAEEGRALAARAPLDLRANALKATRDKALRELAPINAEATALSPDGLRVPPGPNDRPVSVQSEPAFLKGWVEVQDEGSQLAARLSAPPAGGQVLDLCAGGGGKTLALAALMGNHGQIFATDSDKRRLAPIHDRLQRAGVRNTQVRTPRGTPPVDDLADRMDLVLVDAPCTGSGTWRRNPDAKWRLRPNSLADRQRDQARALDTAAMTVRPGGRLAYVTCSVLPEENDAQLAAFRERHAGFTPLDPGEVAEQAGLGVLAAHRSAGGAGLMLSPARTGTDGFFVAVLRRAE